MNKNRSDPSEPIWELEDFLGDEAAEQTDDTETDQDTTPSADTPKDSGTKYDLEQMMEAGSEASVPGSEQASGGSNRLSRSRVLLTGSVLLVVVLSMYVAGPFGSGATGRTMPEPVGALSEQEVRLWLERSRKLTSTFSEHDLSVHSTSLLGFSSELSRRSEVNKLVRKALVQKAFGSYRSTTRDIGNALKLMDPKSGTDNPDPSSRSLIQRNIQVVKEYRDEILSLMQQFQTSNHRVTRDGTPNSSPETSSSVGAGTGLK